MAFGVTNEGFILKRLVDIKNDLITALSTVTDPVSGESLTPDLDDEDDPLIQIVNAFSDTIADAWEHLQLAYNQFDPLKASGAGLSGTVQLNALRRRAGVASQVVVVVTGTPYLVVDAGQQITTMDDTPVFELPAFEIGSGGTTIVVATCTENGPFDVATGTLVKILTPISGWTAVTNPGTAVVGSYEETDEELRARQQISTSNTAQTIPEAILAGLVNTDGVEFAKVYQNISLSTDLRGIPAKTLAAVVIGGEDDDIAQILFDKIAAGGCDTYGDEEVVIEDSQGIEYTMRFVRPTEIPVYIEIEVTVINEDVWPSTGVDDIKAAIIEWTLTGGASLSSTELLQTGYYPGRSVYATELIVPIYSIPGIRVDSVLVMAVDDSSSSGSAELDVSWDEIATFSSDDIDITVN